MFSWIFAHYKITTSRHSPFHCFSSRSYFHAFALLTYYFHDWHDLRLWHLEKHLGLVSKPKLKVSVSSRTNFQTSRSRLGLESKGLVYIPDNMQVLFVDAEEWSIGEKIVRKRLNKLNVSCWDWVGDIHALSPSRTVKQNWNKTLKQPETILGSFKPHHSHVAWYAIMRLKQARNCFRLFSLFCFQFYFRMCDGLLDSLSPSLISDFSFAADFQNLGLASNVEPWILVD